MQEMALERRVLSSVSNNVWPLAMLQTGASRNRVTTCSNLLSQKRTITAMYFFSKLSGVPAIAQNGETLLAQSVQDRRISSRHQRIRDQSSRLRPATCELLRDCTIREHLLTQLSEVVPGREWQVVLGDKSSERHLSSCDLRLHLVATRLLLQTGENSGLAAGCLHLRLVRQSSCMALHLMNSATS